MGIPVADTVWFVAGSSGVADFTDGTALTGFRNLAGGSLTNGAVYTYRAEHPTDKSIWENGSGAYNSGTGVLARTTVSASSTGAKVNFAVAPVVLLTLMKRDTDLLAPLNAPAFTGNGSIGGTFDVGGNFSVATNKMTVTAANGNTLIAGTLSLTSDLAINTNKFNVTASSGNTTVAGTLGVTGDVAVNTNKFNVTASSGNTSIAGTLGVTGASTFTGNVNTVGSSRIFMQPTGDGGLSLIKRGVGTLDIVLQIEHAGGRGGGGSLTGQFYACDNNAWNSNAAGLRIGHYSGTVRSINASGTVNASGADYAEYETKRDGCGLIEKGAIVGFDAIGLVTDRWSLAVTFGIKSTDPSYVGGDKWGTAEALGLDEPRAPQNRPCEAFIQELPAQPILPNAPELPAAPAEPELPEELTAADEAIRDAYQAAVAAHEQSVAAIEAAYAAELDRIAQAHAEATAAIEAANAAELARYQAEAAAYEAERAEYDRARAEFATALEAARQRVDRVAYSGKVPVNVTGASVGDYIIAIEASGDAIAGEAVPSPSFDQYRLAVGRVRRIGEDGRPIVAVIVH